MVDPGSQVWLGLRVKAVVLMHHGKRGRGSVLLETHFIDEEAESQKETQLAHRHTDIQPSSLPPLCPVASGGRIFPNPLEDAVLRGQ